MDIKVGNIVEGKVVKIKPFGAIVLIDEKFHGLIHISHISNNFVQDINEHLKIGETIKVKIISIDKETNKISLSIKEILQNDSQTSNKNQIYNKDKIHETSSKDHQDVSSAFEEKFKEWLKASNERQAGLNKRNKRR